MALTIGAPSRFSIGGRWQTVTTVTMDASYPTGGYGLNGYQMGLPAGLIDSVVINSPLTGITPTYNYATNVIQAFDPTGSHTHTENTAGAYVQNATTGAVTAVAAAVEVPNTTNLSTTTMTVTCIGR